MPRAKRDMQEGTQEQLLEAMSLLKDAETAKRMVRRNVLTRGARGFRACVSGWGGWVDGCRMRKHRPTGDGLTIA